jgi:hypothetical protein
VLAHGRLSAYENRGDSQGFSRLATKKNLYETYLRYQQKIHLRSMGVTFLPVILVYKPAETQSQRHAMV